MNGEDHAHKEQGCDDEPSVTEENHAEETQPKTYEEEHPPKPSIKWPSQVTINTISTAAMAVFTATLWITSCNQLDSMREQTRAMKDQLAEMKSGSADTKTIAESAQTQADNTKALATAAVSQVEQLKAGVEESRKLAAATQESLDLAREQAAIGTRPYISVSKVDVGPFNVGSRPIVNLHYFNFGVSPAVSIAMHKTMVVGKLAAEIGSGQLSDKKIDQDIVKIKKSRKPGSGTVLFTGDPNNFITVKSDVALSSEEMEYIRTKDGGWTVIVFFEYFDVKGNRYSTRYCITHYITGAIASCGGYNKIE